MRKFASSIIDDVFRNLALVVLAVLFLRVVVSPFLPFVWNIELFLIPLVVFGVGRLLLR